MFDPFTTTSRMIAAGFEMAATARRASETLDASRQVVSRRVGMMGDAARSPLEGDYAELARMVPEKVDAFGKAASALAADWWALQAAAMAEMQHLGSLAMKGRPLMPGEWLALMNRSAAFSLRTIERASRMGRNGLAPVHATATANARRLGKGTSV